MAKTVVFDFDGVIHSYKSGWQGHAIILDPPVPEVKEFIDELRSDDYRVVVVSTRCEDLSGIDAVSRWLAEHNTEVDDVADRKPPAICYIDDRAIRFDGSTNTLLEQIKNFKPWHQI